MPGFMYQPLAYTWPQQHDSVITGFEHDLSYDSRKRVEFDSNGRIVWTTEMERDLTEAVLTIGIKQSTETSIFSVMKRTYADLEKGHITAKLQKLRQRLCAHWNLKHWSQLEDHHLIGLRIEEIWRRERFPRVMRGSRSARTHRDTACLGPTKIEFKPSLMQ